MPIEKLPDRSHPIAYMVNAIRDNKPIEGLTAVDISVVVIEIIDSAKAVVFQGSRIDGITATGRVTVQVLAMNDARRLELRAGYSRAVKRSDSRTDILDR